MSNTSTPLTGIERREATAKLEQAASAVSGSRWMAMILPLILALFLLRFLVCVGVSIIGVLAPIALACGGSFETAADLIRLRRERTIQYWLIVSLILTLIFVSLIPVFFTIALQQDDPGGHLVLVGLATVFAGYFAYLLFTMVGAFKATRALNRDTQTNPGIAPEQPEIFQSSSQVTMPPRPSRHGKSRSNDEPKGVE